MKIKKNHLLTMAIMSLLGVNQSAMAAISSVVTLNGVTRTVEFASQAQLDGIVNATAPLAEQLAFANLFSNPTPPSSSAGLVSTSNVCPDGGTTCANPVPVTLVNTSVAGTPTAGTFAVAVPQKDPVTGLITTQFVTATKSGTGATAISATALVAEYVKVATTPGYTPDPALAAALATNVKQGATAAVVTQASTLINAAVAVAPAAPVVLPTTGAITDASITTVTDPAALVEALVQQEVAKASLNTALAITPTATPTTIAAPAGTVATAAADPVAQLASAQSQATATKAVATTAPANLAFAATAATVGANINLVSALSNPAIPAAQAPTTTVLAQASADLATATTALQTQVATLPATDPAAIVAQAQLTQAAAAAATVNAAVVNSLPTTTQQTAAATAATAQTTAAGTAQALAAAKAALATTLADPAATDAAKTAALNAVKTAATADATAQQDLATKQGALAAAQTTLAATQTDTVVKAAITAGVATVTAAQTAATAAAGTSTALSPVIDTAIAAQTVFAGATTAAVQPAADLAAAQTAFTAAVAPGSTLTDVQKQAAWTDLVTKAQADATAKQTVATAQQALLASYTAAGVTPTLAQTTALTAAQTAATDAAAAVPAALALANNVQVDAAGNLVLFDAAIAAAAAADRATVAAEQAKVASAIGTTGTDAAKVAEHAARLDAALATVQIAGKQTAADTVAINDAAANYVQKLAEVKTTQFQAKNNSTSGIAGNPASNMNMAIDGAFNQVADFGGTNEASKANVSAASADIGGVNTSVGVGLQYGYYNIGNKSVNTVTMPLSVTAKFNPKHQLTLSVPLSYIQTQSQADAYQVGVTAAYKYNVSDNWSLTPSASYSYRSFDNSQNQYWNPNTSTSLVGGSITSKYTWNFSGIGLSLINMIGHYQTLDSEKNTTANLNITTLANNFVGTSLSNNGIASYVVKNGLHATKMFGNFKLGAYFTDTEYFGSRLYFNQLNEFGFSLKPVNAGKMLDALSIDANYLFSIGGKHSSELDGFRLNLGYKF